MTAAKRASRDEIQNHLNKLLGSEAQEVVQHVCHLLEMGDKETGLTILRNYDETLGGTGIYKIQDKKLPGVYRALTYVWLPLQGDHPEYHAREMIHAACCYLEELLKKMVRIWPWEEIKADSLPLGALVNRVRKRLPLSIYDELDWLARGVYNFAKHHYNTENDDLPEPDHYFGLDEAITVYLIVRKLGLELESFFKYPTLRLINEYN